MRISSGELTEIAPSLELRLLGPPMVFVNGHEVVLPTRKSLALVAYLACEGAQTRAHLAELLWGDLDDEGARKNLRKELFRLRDTPLKAHLETEGDRVSLVAFDSDAARFGVLTETQPERALVQYGGALLAGLDVPGADRFQDWLEAKRERFEGLYRRVLEAHARTLEGAGDLRGAMDAFETLTALDELQEVHHREVMRLRWRLGDRAGALERYARLVSLLEGELGLEPLPETTALARRIESGETPDELPDSSSTASPKLAPSLERPPLVGRERAWMWLESRQRGLSLVVAEAGVGKTRLVTDFARAQGRTLILRGFESATGTPLYPVAAALRAALEAGQLEPDSLPDIWRLEAARLVPELAPNLRQTDGPSSADGRARFLEGLARTILMAVGSDGVLVLDDLHWFDTSSLELIAHLARRVNTVLHGVPDASKNTVQDGVSPRLLATARSLELLENPSAQSTLGALEREGKLRRYELEPLAPKEVLALVQALSGDRAQLFAERLFNATGGNPLFVLETLRGLFQSDLLRLEDGHWITPYDDETTDYTELPIPPNVREMALSRLDRLGPAARRWLEAASLAGEPFDAGWLEGATALSDWEQLEALERAIQAQVLQDADGLYRFSHDLIRRSLSDGLGAERRRLIHRRLAANLMTQSSGTGPSGTGRGQPAAIADHLERAGRPTDAIPWRVQAAEASELIYAHAEARDHYHRALALEPDDRTAFAIHRAMANLSVSALDLAGLELHAEAMLALADCERDPELEAEARLTLAKLAIYRGQFADALEQTEHARVTVSGALKVETRLVAGTALVALGRLEGAESTVLDGLASAAPRAHGAIAELHAIMKVIHQQRGDYASALEHARAAVAAYRSARHKENELNMTAQMGQLLGAMGDSRAALELIDNAVAQTRAMGFEKILTVALVLQAEESLRSNDLETAATAIQEGLSLTTDRMLAREAQFTSLGARMYQRQGRYAEALDWSRRAFTLTERLGLAVQRTLQHLYTSDLHLDLGQVDAAQALLETASNLVIQSGQAALRLLSETLHARLELERADPAKALERLEEARDSVRVASFEHRALYACVLAQARLTDGDPAGAVQALEGLAAPRWLEPRVLAARLEAHTKLPSPRARLESDLEAATRLLGSENPSPLEALVLHRAMTLGLAAVGQDRRARALRDEVERLNLAVQHERQAALERTSTQGTLRERSRA
jgi:DNA-binding SARP family transcriptional activator/ATP/maltotriose-dependent transcriptional regulator MalT